MPKSKKRPLTLDLDPTSEETDSEVSRTPVCSRRIKIDLKTSLIFLRSTKADNTYVGKEERLKGQSLRSILNTYLVNHVDADLKNPDVGWVNVKYYFSDIGYFLKDLGVIEGSRMYAEGDPFTLPSALTDLLTGRFYRNWDDSKAFQHYMLGCKVISDANRQVIEEYLETDREDIAAHYGEDMDAKTIKRVTLMLTFGGSLNTFRQEYDIGCEDHPLLVRYHGAMKKITKELVQSVGVDRRQEFYDFMRKHHPEKERCDETLKSYIIQDVEYKAQQGKLGVFKELGVTPGSMEHDGVKELVGEGKPLAAEDMSKKLTEAASEAIGAHVPVVLKKPSEVLTQLGDWGRGNCWTIEIRIEDIPLPRSLRELNMKIKTAVAEVKAKKGKDTEVADAITAITEMEQKFEGALRDRAARAAWLNATLGLGMCNDEENARRILRHFDGELYGTGLGLMMYDEDSGVWTREDAEHEKLVLCWSSKLLKFKGDDASKVTAGSLFKAAYSIIKCIAEKKDVADMVGSRKQIGHLLFQNGVLDMSTFKMKPKEPDYFFLWRINRKFDVTNKGRGFADLVEEILQRLFDKPFTDVNKRDYFLELLARGVAGEVGDRQFMMPIGPTACGKGKMTMAIRRAFGDFVGTFDAANLVADTKSMMEPSRKLTWLADGDLWAKRIIIANEFPMISERSNRHIQPIDGMVIKALISGGTDPLVMRRLYSHGFSAPCNLAFLVVFANDIPPARPADDAYLSRANCIGFDRGASDAITEDNNHFFVKDSNIDEYVTRSEVADGFIALLCYYYNLSKINGRKEKPKSVLMETKERTTREDGTLEEFLQSKFVLYPGKAAEEFLDNEKSTPEVRVYDRRKIGDWWIPSREIYHDWQRAGNNTSETQFGKDLSRFGLEKYRRKVDGHPTWVRIGIRNSTITDINNNAEDAEE